MSYKETANIRLLRDVLNSVRGKGVVIYIEVRTSLVKSYPDSVNLATPSCEV